MPLVQLTDLCKIYSAGDNEVRALGGVSLSIEAGEFVAITGQSGSGKSTLMNMLGCLDAPDAGSYLLDGKNVADIPETVLAGIRNRRIGRSQPNRRLFWRMNRPATSIRRRARK